MSSSTHMPAINLLALPCAGASATMYLRWRRLLPEWIRVVPVELPGRGARTGEPYVEDFAQLVAQICNEQAAAMQGSYVLFGHSMGALLAHAVAQRRHALALPMPEAVFVSASPAPSSRDPGRFAAMDNDAALMADLRRQGGTPDAVFENTELLRLTLDSLAADYRVCANFRYLPSDPLSVPLHVFAGRQDDIDPQRIEAWRREARHAYTLDWFDGAHFFIRQQEQKVLATIVRELTRLISGVGHAAAATV
ncbi:thioesterase domain protein [Achromobacter xylosoxidans A8]|uniref:Thioesterase domain protein n=1 Tax=Achromobacter xylosoxidans (strain A8) TaxID=762376 RepID=E3HPS9_ACHXA|nr:alpha/beta fold hydrolase [Achromobacter xylosoxidans]ADP15913.1 thioesterase domain protein [Achromobacter xylosoxidans A8]